VLTTQLRHSTSNARTSESPHVPAARSRPRDSRLETFGSRLARRAFVPLVTLEHLTTYRYAQPVTLGEHRLMVRPRESFDQRLLDATLKIFPEPSELRWLQDVFGNAVALATFRSPTRELRIVSTIRVQHSPLGSEEIKVERYARRYPFTYASEDMPDLLRSIERAHHDPNRSVDQWARAFLTANETTDTLDMLRRMTEHIHEEFDYVARYEKGIQTPTETMVKRSGCCRDFAVLMIEAARALGFAARFVSGYLYDPALRRPMVGGGNTHAWVRIFLPGSGWVEFDPTNGIVGNSGLIRVAVARDPLQAAPISGTWNGVPGDDIGMTVGVDVYCHPDPASAADGGEREAVELGETERPTSATRRRTAAESAPDA
jgi:transglutaminase-like putative cysteine protease